MIHLGEIVTQDAFADITDKMCATSDKPSVKEKIQRYL